MQAPKFNKQLQNAVYMILLFSILAIGVFFFVTKPFAQSLKTVQAEFKAKVLEKAEKKQKVSDLKTLKTKLEGYKSTSDPLVKALPVKADIPGILVQIEALFIDMGLPMESFSVPSAATSESTPPQSGTIGLEGTQTETQTPTSGYSLSKLSFGLGTSGSYSQLINFMTALQDNLRIIRMTDFSLIPAKEGADFSFSCTVQMYYLSKGSGTEGITQGENQ